MKTPSTQSVSCSFGFGRFVGIQKCCMSESSLRTLIALAHNERKACSRPGHSGPKPNKNTNGPFGINGLAGLWFYLRTGHRNPRTGISTRKELH